MSQFRSAVIGCGNISRRHIAALSGSEHAKLICACDIKEEKARAVAEKEGCDFCADYHTILNDPTIDCVHICTPHYLHAPIALEAMEKGKHVFTEKPMAMTTADCNAMTKTAERTGKHLGICFQNRYKSTNAALYELVRSGKAGRPLGGRGIVTWHRTPEYYSQSGWRGAWKTEGGGVLINQSIHTLDLLLWVLGKPVSVSARCATARLSDTIEVEDTADAVISFENGAQAVFFATNCYCADSPVLFEIMCENALLRVGDELEIFWNDGRREVIKDTSPTTDDKSYWGNCHNIIIDDFYRSILENRPFAVNGGEGIKAIALIEEIYKSAGIKRSI